MRNVTAKLFMGLAITTITVFGADNSIGTWKLNVAKSKSNTAPLPFTSLTIVKEASDGGVKTAITGARPDGTQVEMMYSLKYDGKPVPATGGAYDMISMKQINANSFTAERTKTGGKYHTTSRVVIAKDGKAMTNIMKGTGADGKPLSLSLVFDKQ